MAMLAVGPDAAHLTEIPRDPKTLDWGLQDISSADAGRTLAAGNPMVKNRTSQKRKLDLTWTMLTEAQASEILKLFNPEYFYVRYYDVMSGEMEVRRFYAGDRKASVKWFRHPKLKTKFGTLSFDIIEV